MFLPIIVLGIVGMFAVTAMVVGFGIAEARLERRNARLAEATSRAYVAYLAAGVNPYRAHALAVSNRRAARLSR